MMTLEIIHIGFPKAASKTLQEHLFGGRPDVVNAARPFADERSRSLCAALAFSDDVDYPEAEFSSIVDDCRAKASRLLIYSDESVVNSAIRSIAAKRLKRLFPDAQILAVLRNQLDAFAAHYANSGRRLRPAPDPYSGRHVSFKNHLAFHHAHPKRSFLATLKYHETLEVYEQLFGRDRVHVLLFEEFRRDRQAFVSKLSSILDMDPAETENRLAGRHEHKRTIKAVGHYQAFRSRFLWGVPLSRMVPGNRYIKQTLLRLWGDGPLDVAYPDGWRDLIGDHFRKGNSALCERYGLALKHYDYPL